jgi:ABC-type antimicrobial peptide transport system permease subunit
VIGAVGAIVLTPLVQSMLFETSMRDWNVVLSIACVLGAVAVLAAVVPALRAARVNPSVALQAE